jgi:hypothetical protein
VNEASLQIVLGGVQGVSSATGLEGHVEAFSPHGRPPWLQDKGKSNESKEIGLTHRMVKRKLVFVEGIHLDVADGVRKDVARSPAAAGQPVKSPEPGTLQDEGGQAYCNVPSSTNAAGRLVVNESTEPSGVGPAMSDDDLWKESCKFRKDWPFLYAAYHHFRKKVWL